jgi:phage terminase large subunit
MTLSPSIDFPDKLQGLFEDHRYKVLYGGRGGAKSWGIARALLIRGTQRPTRVLCAREFQNSIRDSVHKLLSDQIDGLGLGHLYEVQQTLIKGPGGTEFAFEGIKHNVGKIKSYEGVDVCWVEEAHAVSKSSWDVLIPTIRKPGSEIWVSFNPELETDETYQRFVKAPPVGAWVQEISWRDNPWFPDVLRGEMEDLKARDYDAYLNVWEGKCKVLLEGAVYGDELRELVASGRLCSVPYDRLLPVHVFMDLGWADSTTLWFAQLVGFETRIIDYYENSQKPFSHYLDVMQNRKYILGDLWLPHDAKAKQLGTGRSIEEIARASGRSVRIVPRLSVTDGINAAREIFPNVWIDKDKCADGLNALRHYRFEVIQDSGTFSRQPVHDWASHGADAFRYLAVGLKERPKKGGVASRLAKALSLRKGNVPPNNFGWLT